jgi:hypothetical protein
MFCSPPRHSCLPACKHGVRSVENKVAATNQASVLVGLHMVCTHNSLARATSSERAPTVAYTESALWFSAEARQQSHTAAASMGRRTLDGSLGASPRYDYHMHHATGHRVSTQRSLQGTLHISVQARLRGCCRVGLSPCVLARFLVPDWATVADATQGPGA